MASYETIVADGQTITINDGETWENKLIDVQTNPNAGIRIEAWADNWTIRNVGIKGTWERETDGHEQLFSVRVDSASATGTIENVYFADGCTDNTFPGITGIYVNAYHSGTLNISNVNIQDTPNNAIYGSNPHGTGEGEVNIIDSYGSDCLSSHFRVGTDGSSITNCVAVRGNRGVWALQGNVSVDGCDLSDATTNRADGDIVAGSNTDPSDAYVTVTDTYYGTSAPGDQGINYPGTIDGGSISSVRRTQPDEVTGVPLTATEAAEGDGTTDTDLFEITTTTGISNFEYTFTADGEITRAAAAESSDIITDNGDGTWTADGVVGDGFNDSFNVAGDILEFNPSPTPDGVTLYLNGNLVRFGGDLFEITTTSSVSNHDYDFTCDGAIERGPDAEPAPSDTITDNGDGTWTADGVVGDGYDDSYYVYGPITDYNPSPTPDGVTLYRAGNEWTLNEGGDEPQPEPDAKAIRVSPGDGQTDTHYVFASSDYEYGKQTTVQVVLDRQDLNDLNIVEGVDELYIEDASGRTEWGGVVRDIQRGGGVTGTVLADSFERYAREAEPLPTRTTFDNVDDATVIKDAISRVPELSEGTIENIKSGITLVYSDVSPAKQMRTVRDVTKGRLVFNADKTVDYLEQVGEDKR